MMGMANQPPCTWGHRPQAMSVTSAQRPFALAPATVRGPSSSRAVVALVEEARAGWSSRAGAPLVAEPKAGGGRRGGARGVRATLAAEQAPAKVDLSGLKAELLSRVAGLDRGLVATPADQDAVNQAARKLESAGNAVEFPDDLDLLQGRWRLVYSSAFASGSVGGQRPGPPIGRLVPLTLGQVLPRGQAYQRIDVPTRQCDNIVDLRIAAPWPLPPAEVTATLAHTFELTGGGVLRIVFDKTTVKAAGALSQLPPLEVPQLPDFLRTSTTGVRSAEFDNTFVDEDTRISRGDRGELRVYVKA